METAAAKKEVRTEKSSKRGSRYLRKENSNKKGSKNRKQQQEMDSVACRKTGNMIM